MDRATHEYYVREAPILAERYSAAGPGVDRYFRHAFGPGSRVLDIGAGSGRDLNTLLEMGYDARGVEPCEPMRRLAVARYPALGGRLHDGALPDLRLPSLAPFDGISCSAVLMHLPESRLFDAAFAIRRLLKPLGTLLVSIPRTRPGRSRRLRTSEHRDRHGRLFTPLNPSALALLYERLGFELVDEWHDEDALGREGYSWTTLLLKLRDAGALRPIDKIEGVLNQDRKVATYKLALFRALCDIARTNHRTARWREDGGVAIPFGRIAELWIRYYWPLLDRRDRFIPQLQGEKQGGGLHMAFRPLLEQLISEYRGLGGLNRFLVDFAGDELPPVAGSLVARLVSKLTQTIRSGPATYAGGSLETGRLFDWSGGDLLVSSDVWREICLAGHWIHDALLLRWGELTHRISRGGVRTSEVVDLLLTPISPERDVSAAKDVYRGLSDLECVWTGRRLGPRFDVDHLLPHALWRTNDLWNLLPTSGAVNRQKSDRLPEHDLLVERRPALTRSWDALADAHPDRFAREASALVGRDSPALDDVFSAVVEAVEVTALQRGCRRWAPGCG